MTTSEQPQLRPAAEVQRAHDLVTGILLNPNIELEAQLAVTLEQMAGVLCWALNHDHNPAFPKVLRALEERARAEGMVLIDSGQLIRPEGVS